eukprot:793675-Rhodomonas_salina.2
MMQRAARSPPLKQGTRQNLALIFDARETDKIRRGSSIVQDEQLKSGKQDVKSNDSVYRTKNWSNVVGIPSFEVVVLELSTR